MVVVVVSHAIYKDCLPLIIFAKIVHKINFLLYYIIYNYNYIKYIWLNGARATLCPVKIESENEQSLCLHTATENGLGAIAAPRECRVFIRR